MLRCEKCGKVHLLTPAEYRAITNCEECGAKLNKGQHGPRKDYTDANGNLPGFKALMHDEYHWDR